MDENRICDCCGEEINEEEEDFYELEDGTILCSSCYENEYDECAMCGEIVRIDDMFPWGDCRICPECMEEQCPSFDQEENEAETTQAYENMKAKYVGRKALEYQKGTFDFDYESDDPCVLYTLSVTFDDDGVITDISRLSAEMLISEDVKSSETRDYPISDDDYVGVVDKMFDDNIKLE